MDEKFTSYKKRMTLYAFIKCALIGAAAAMFCIGVVLLSCKLAQHNLFAWIYVLIGIVGFAAGGGISYIFLHVTEYRLAQNLDSAIGRERVRTALAYKGSEGDICELQRADAAARIAPLKPTFTKMWVFILVVALSLAILLSGAFIKANAIEAPPEPPVKPSEWQESRLNYLILYVRNSDADADTKDGTEREIIKLINIESYGVTGSALGDFVIESVSNIRAVYMAANEKYTVTQGQEEPEEYTKQKEINHDVGEYVIEELYIIFDVEPPSFGDDDENNDKKDPEEEDPGDINEDPSHGGEVVGSQSKFYDPELGSVYYSDVLPQYYNAIEQAMNNGDISSDEWYDIVQLYYQILNGVH